MITIKLINFIGILCINRLAVRTDPFAASLDACLTRKFLRVSMSATSKVIHARTSSHSIALEFQSSYTLINLRINSRRWRLEHTCGTPRMTVADSDDAACSWCLGVVDSQLVTPEHHHPCSGQSLPWRLRTYLFWKVGRPTRNP